MKLLCILMNFENAIVSSRCFLSFFLFIDFRWIIYLSFILWQNTICVRNKPFIAFYVLERGHMHAIGRWDKQKATEENEWVISRHPSLYASASLNRNLFVSSSKSLFCYSRREKSRYILGFFQLVSLNSFCFLVYLTGAIVYLHYFQIYPVFQAIEIKQMTLTQSPCKIFLRSEFRFYFN